MLTNNERSFMLAQSVSKKNRVFALFLLVSAPIVAAEDSFQTEIRNYAIKGIAIISATGCVYNWITKKLVEKSFTSYKKRFKNHAFLADRYELALSALADYKDYADIIGQIESPEERAKQICQQIKYQYGSNPSLIPHFKKEVRKRHTLLSQKSKEVDRALLDWQESTKKALLAAQGPAIKKSFSSIVTTLDSLLIHIPYIEAELLVKSHSTLLQEERSLSQYLSDEEQLSLRLSHLIRNKTRIGERYPYRTYTTTLEIYHKRIAEIEKELEPQNYHSFQGEVIGYIKSTYKTLDALKKYLKSSKEFESECVQYDAEVLAIAKEKENDQLKKELASMKDEMSSLKKPTQE